MTTPVNSATDSSASAPAAAQKRLDSNYADFLKLLTTQLQNQDPTAPMDTNQLTQQIATLSQVEQQINTNKSLQELITLFSTSQLNDAVSYIGKQIDAVGNKGVLAAGKPAAFVYGLPAGAMSAEVIISDATGKVVFTGAGTTLAGRNEVFWNGTNSITGAAMPPGTYAIKVTAKDADGKEIAATPLTSGTVTAVETRDGKTTLSLGTIPVALSDVQSVRNPVTLN